MNVPGQLRRGDRFPNDVASFGRLRVLPVVSPLFLFMELEIKLNCLCGTRYGFFVEPEEGQMPVPVACPTCGTDGTAPANTAIQQRLAEIVKSITGARPSVRVVLPGHPPPPPPAATSKVAH